MSKLNSKTFFTENDKKKIEKTIKDVETKTSGEIVAMVVPESNRYPDIEILGALLFSVILSLMILYFIPNILWGIAPLFLKSSDAFLNNLILLPFQLKNELRYVLMYGVWYFIPITFVLFFIFWWTFYKFSILKRIFLTNKRKEIEIKECSIKAFYEQGLYKTRDETGVLFFISLLEKKVYILADKGIYEKITQETLNEYAKNISKGIKEKRGVDALCESIKNSGEIFAKYFPIKPDDINELSNSVITWWIPPIETSWNK